MKWIPAAFLVLGFICNSLQTVAADDATAVSGTTISMTPPDTFVLSRHFAGFENPNNSSSITVVELPKEAHQEVSKIFENAETATAMFGAQNTNIVFTEQEFLEVSGVQVPMIIGTQKLTHTDVVKYVTLFGGEKTVLITFNVMDRENTTREEVVAAVKSITHAEVPSLEVQLAQLSFEFQSAEPFDYVSSFGGSSASLQTFENTDPSGKRPRINIVRGLIEYDSVESIDISRHAEHVFRGTKDSAQAIIHTAKVIDFAGHRGYLIEAKENGNLHIQYFALPADGRHIRLVARGEQLALENFMEQVHAIAASVSIKE